MSQLLLTSNIAISSTQWRVEVCEDKKVLLKLVYRVTVGKEMGI